MPVTKTAKRALRSSARKESVNRAAISKLEVSIRLAKKSKTEKDIKLAVSLADRASKKKIIHSNKAARIKSSLSKLLPRKSRGLQKPTTKKVGGAKKSKKSSKSSKGRSSSGGKK